ncbi:TerB family tellurite resistance protein [Shewanella sp. 10N.286.48.A6]|uniref:TerB family tellurite resistance protein n=1 Tax=Shewanella sp. 10N.286.48.A6 TaxID=1880833 RepID=UPI000C85ADFB|nr:TerB family tellurite resistance protein [Shewanella sp. 10N.286.48.A6]PMI01882.1 hypothetical protein BCU55_09390 [Shewanella sp. 10N.286.48.A6]
MYLSELNIGEKKNFLELAHFSMGLNGTHKDEELEVFQSFMHECELPSYELSKQQNIEGVTKVISKSSNKNKRIVLLELFGILLADGDVCEEESNFMSKLSAAMGFEEYEMKKIHRWVLAMNDLYLEGQQLINKE